MADPNTAASRMAQAMIVRRAVAAGDWDSAALARTLEARALDLAGGPGDDRADDSAVDSGLCGFLGHVLARRGPDVHDYLSGVISYGPQSLVDRRHGCGRRLFRLTVTVKPLRGGHRHLYVCERCGVSGNVAEGAPLPDLTIGRDGELRVRRSGSSGWYTAARQPVGGHREESIGVWPLPDGPIAFDVPVRPQDGLRRWAVAMVSGADYTVVQVPVETAGKHPRRQR